MVVVVVEVVVVVVVVVVSLFPPKRPAMASEIHLYQSHLLVMEEHYSQCAENHFEADEERHEINLALVHVKKKNVI